MTKQEKAALVSVATNSVLTLVKFILASVTASVALLAEAYHSLADISKARELLGYRARVEIEEGLRLTIEWFSRHHR